MFLAKEVWGLHDYYINYVRVYHLRSNPIETDSGNRHPACTMTIVINIGRYGGMIVAFSIRHDSVISSLDLRLILVVYVSADVSKTARSPKAH